MKNAKWAIMPRCGLIVLMLLFAGMSISKAQNTRQVKGVVKDQSDGSSLPGVTVHVKGTKNVVTTNSNGEFVVNVKNSDILQVSYIGFEPKAIGVGNKTSITVSLNPSVSNLTEVVVVGYGKIEKPNLTGSVAEVKVEDLAKAPVSSFTEALAGRVAGVQVSSSDGQPGSTPDIVIRGAGSLTQSTAPLYVIDGFPMEDFEPNSISQNDIESINILKDASATAIYGSRAANGVVLIETKKGMNSRSIVALNSSYGFQQVPRKLDVMSPYEFVKYHAELKPTTTATRYFKDGKTLDSYRNVEGIDWQDLLFEEPPTQIYNLSVRGGNQQTKYAISGNIFNGKGIVIETGSKRYQGRVTLDHEVSKFLKVGVNVNRSYTEAYGTPAAAGASSNSTSFLFYNGWGYRPITGNEEYDLLNEDVDEENINANEMRVNPVKTAQNAYRRFYTNTLTSVAYADLNFTKNLKLRVTGNVNERIQTNDAFFNSKTTQGSPRNLSNTRGVNASTVSTDTFTWSNENVLSYINTFNKIHKINAIAGFSSQRSSRKGKGVAVMNIPNEELVMSGLDEGTPYASVATSAAYSLASFFGRVHYNLKSKYTIEATFRGDGSSKFFTTNQWGYFPSGSVSWNIKAEPWMKHVNLFSAAKIRASYGITGNNRVGEWDDTPGISFPMGNNYSFNNATPTKAAILAIGNSELAWERTHQMDVGLDLGLFKNRINFTVDYYKKQTKDLLLYADLPLTTGFTRIYRNIGELQNEGLEFSFASTNVKTRNFGWDSNFNISFNRNKVISLVENQKNLFTFLPFETQYNSSPLYIAQVGQAAGMFYGYVFDGVYQYEDFNGEAGTGGLKNSIPTNGDDREVIRPGDIKYKDLNGDGVVNSYDQTVIGDGMPLHVGGFNNNFRYKNFSLNVFFQWSYGNEIMNANRLVLEGNGLQRTDLNQFASYVDRWSPENPTNRNYRANGQGPLGRYSSRTLEDGSYLRLKTLAFSYSVPSKLIKRLHMSKLQLSLASQNLITWSNYSGWDPEVSVRNSVLTPGFDYSAYPQARTLVFGLNATF